MKQLHLEPIENNYKIGQRPPNNEPNVLEDSLFVDDGEVIGFYLKKLPSEIKNLVQIADIELNSERVPKSTMRRSSGMMEKEKSVEQYSCIIGSVPPKPHMRRSYATRSSVHLSKTARTFVKAMTIAGEKSLKIIKEIAPNIYEKHKEAMIDRVPEKWRFAEMFTSSISNYNISADIHQDTGNVKNCVNVIITKRLNAKGGNLYLPDYDLTIDSANNSMLVYPAWRNKHGVTEIVKTHDNGYRNSLIWYCYDGFANEKR
tara:strand:- start:2107 stop:2883 length:777 start_codon:yes stop_codon:yes gene_type:complete